MVTASSIRRCLEALVVPPVCVLCGAPTHPVDHVCLGCFRAFSELEPGEWWWGFQDDTLDIQEIACAFQYEGIAKDLVGAFKFRGMPAVARDMAMAMFNRVGAHFQAPDMIVPVPSHPDRLRERGFSPSLELARAWAKETENSKRLYDCLRRNPAVASAYGPQSTLERARRLTLPRDAIVFDESVKIPDYLTSSGSVPTYVLLLDDVRTTGVTLDRCASAIRERFPSEVKALTFASTRAKPGHDNFG